jgi:hypothetical protein
VTDGKPDAGDGDAAGDASEALSIAKELRELIKAILEKLTDAVKYGRRTRLMSWLLAASVVLDVGLSVLTVHLYIGQAQVSRDIHRSQVRACAIGNDFRTRQRQLWDHVIAVSVPPPGETAAQRHVRLARLAAFRVYIGRQFHPVDCAALYRSR